MNAPENSPGAPREAAVSAEGRFGALFEHAPFSVQLLALDGRTLEVNKAWETLWEVDKAEILPGYNIFEDEQLQQKGVTPYVKRAFAGESVVIPPVLYDPSSVGKPGRARWVQARAHPIAGADGQIREVMLIHEDVTERMRSEEAVRASEQRLKQLADTIPQLAWMADPSGYVHWYNRRWYDYTGATPEEMKGWGWQCVHDPAYLPEVLARWTASIERGIPFEMTVPLRGRDGQFRPFLTLVAPLLDEQGRVTQWFGTNTDISALQKAEAELRKAEERLRIATEAGGIGIWEWDVEEDRVTWSDKLYPLHGLSPGEFGGRAADFTALLHPEDRAPLWHKVETAIGEGSGFSAEFRTVLPDGQTRWLSTWARAQRTEGTGRTRLIGATISIDAYKRAEATLKESDRRKDELLAMLAHELRNPLAPISTAAHLLQSAGYDEARVRHFSGIIHRQVKHMTDLVDDLLDVSRVTRGLVQLQMEPLDLKTIVSTAIEQVRPLIEAREHVLKTWSDAASIMVLGDRTRLLQVVVNLLNNAAKYTPRHGQIELRIELGIDEVTLSVIDNGIGIDRELLPRVFDLFTQAQRTPDRSQGGLGIGLALVKTLVALHKGRFGVHSDGPGSGSTFFITLPLIERPVQETHNSEEAPQARAPGQRRILVVDDNTDAAETLAALLRMLGHEVSFCNDAATALRQAAKAPPDVFILDIGLPDMDGHELARALRSQRASGPALYVALTGYGQAHDRARSREAGFDHHLVKPVDIQTLESVLASAG